MSQVTSAEVPSGSGLSVRSGINAVLSALISTNSGPSEPPNPVAGMAWFDTTANDIKIRNAANTAWVLLSDMIGALEYDRVQTLTAPQQTQARTNIGASQRSDNVRYDTAQGLSAAQKLIASNNIEALTFGQAQVLSDAQKAIARSNIYAPLSPDFGSFGFHFNAAGDSLWTPAGGRWAVFYIAFDVSSGGLAGGSFAGVYAGGTQLYGSNLSINRVGYRWRIS